MRHTSTAALTLLCALAGCASRAPAPVAPPGPASAPSTGRVSAVVWPEARRERVKVELYVMSKCPYGADALLAAKALFDAVGAHLELRVDYIASVDEQGKLGSLHGDSELEGDALQLCVQKLYPTATFVRFAACQSQSYATIPADWERCADDAGVSRYKLRSCTRSEGEGLLRASLRRAQAANASGSPTILIAGKPHEGERTLVGFLRPVCESLRGTVPARCRTLPAEPPVRALILNDKRCASCATDTLVKNLQARFFPRLSVRTLDYGTPEGKRLFAELRLRHLPAILFDSSVTRAASYDSLQRWLADVGSYKQLRIPATFDPTAEICDNGIDDTGDGKIDCADATCVGKLVCRKEIKARLDVFVMSQCPYAATGVASMKEVLKTFKGALDFDLHYIVERVAGGFNALHGAAEVEENQRQLCAKKLYRRGNRYLDYLWCRGADYRSDDWQRCATGPISAAKIEACVRKEGAALLGADHTLTTQLEISASPTWLANNRYTFNGLSAEAIISEVCKRNPTLRPCKHRKPASTQPASLPTGSCGR